jgi:hypothetical protein
MVVSNLKTSLHQASGQAGTARGQKMIVSNLENKPKPSLGPGRDHPKMVVSKFKTSLNQASGQAGVNRDSDPDLGAKLPYTQPRNVQTSQRLRFWRPTVCFWVALKRKTQIGAKKKPATVTEVRRTGNLAQCWPAGRCPQLKLEGNF